jgi:fructose-bisphosphate aldolase, class I
MNPTTAAAPKKAPDAQQHSRPTLDDMDVSIGKRVKMHRLLYEYGVGNGTLMVLPIDQGIAHGPVDFFANPDSLDPEFQWRLAQDGGYNALACHWGLARDYMRKYAGKVPLILKLNGRSNIPPDDDAFSTLTASVEDAVSLGADAIGYTLYVGSPRQDLDIEQFAQVREACEKYSMPIVVWSYPRGEAIEKKGGRDSLYAVEYGARLAHEFGADIIKLNMPKKGPKDAQQPMPYDTLEWDEAEGVRRVVQAAGRSLVLFSGGSKLDDEDVMAKATLAMSAGATGLIFGRNMWQRQMDDALALTGRVKEMLKRYPA